MIEVANSNGINNTTIKTIIMREDYTEALTVYRFKLMAFLLRFSEIYHNRCTVLLLVLL